MNEPDDSGERGESEHEPPPRQMQFSLFTLCATITLLCVPFAIWGAMLRPNQMEPSPLLVLLCVIAPVALMIAVSVIGQIKSWQARRARRGGRPPESDDS